MCFAAFYKFLAIEDMHKFIQLHQSNLVDCETRDGELGCELLDLSRKLFYFITLSNLVIEVL